MQWLRDTYNLSLEQSRTQHCLDSGILPDGTNVGRFSTEAVKEYLFQKTPQNGMDGAFLSRVGFIGTCNRVQAVLMKIKFEEAGSGDIQEHHPNVFYELITQDLGIKLPSIDSLDKDPRLIECAFDDPVFQLAISQFPNRFLPEILGMTLLLEWTGSLEAFKMAKMLRLRGINPRFYRIHIVADNVKTGHAHEAKEAIKLYLREIRDSKGEQEMQAHWRRIYQGWHTWNCILEGFDKKLLEHLSRFDAKLAA